MSLRILPTNLGVTFTSKEEFDTYTTSGEDVIVDKKTALGDLKKVTFSVSAPSDTNIFKSIIMYPYEGASFCYTDNGKLRGDNLHVEVASQSSTDKYAGKTTFTLEYEILSNDVAGSLVSESVKKKEFIINAEKNVTNLALDDAKIVKYLNANGGGRIEAKIDFKIYEKLKDTEKKLVAQGESRKIYISKCETGFTLPTVPKPPETPVTGATTESGDNGERPQ